MSTDRITDLEIQLAHQAAAIEDLSDVVRIQGDDIARLRRRLALLLERAAETELAEGGTVPLADRRPPHW